jgi:hypothetical protein
MTAAPTTYGDVKTTDATRPGPLKRVITGAAVFDGAMGIACLAAAGTFGDWLSIPTGAVRATGGVFLVAAVAGAWTLRRRPADVRAIVGANAVFALWCLLLLAADGPNAVGASLLVVSVLASAATAVLEHRLAGSEV